MRVIDEYFVSVLLQLLSIFKNLPQVRISHSFQPYIPLALKVEFSLFLIEKSWDEAIKRRRELVNSCLEDSNSRLEFRIGLVTASKNT